MHQLGKPVKLLCLRTYKFRRIAFHILMLCGKKLQLCLHYCERRAKFMCGIPGKLALCCERFRKPVEHQVHRNAELPEFLYSVFIEPYVRDTVLVYLFSLLRKLSQRFQRLSADEVGYRGADDSHRDRDQPAFPPEISLYIIYFV